MDVGTHWDGMFPNDEAGQHDSDVFENSSLAYGGLNQRSQHTFVEKYAGGPLYTIADDQVQLEDLDNCGAPERETVTQQSQHTSNLQFAGADETLGYGNSEKRKQPEECTSPPGLLKKPRAGAPGSLLADLLANDTTGAIITRAYTTNNGFLTQQARKFLVNLIVNSELQKALANVSLFGNEQLREFTIPTSTLVTYSNEIAALFPSEDAKGYFNPFCSVAGVRKDASGRLYEHYIYTKAVLRESGLLAKPAKTSRNGDQVIVTFDQCVTEKLNWLETNSKPHEMVLDAWRATFDARRKLLLNQKLPVFDYYGKFLSLRMQEGVYLIESDFARLYPNEATALQSKWDLIKDHLIAKLQSAKTIRNVEDKALALLLPTLARDPQASVIFHLLPYIIPQARVGRKKKCSAQETTNDESQKLSLQERRDSFTIRASTAVDVEVQLTRVKEALMKCGQTFQPTPVVVGTITEIEAFYVAVDTTLYRTNSYIDAVDLTFKIFFATNCAYPERSRPIWQLLEKGVFAITDQPGKCQSNVQLLAGELNFIIAKNSSVSKD